MADERYQWLDLEAAERLLRGDKVDPVDDHARDQAERLAEALDSARPAPLADTVPLPGEEAAMAAFRAASLARAAAPAPAPSPASAAEPDGVRPVAPAGRPRRVRWTRSFRFGLAASVAGLAVGGVAVAAGTGMLPTPFDGPAPASSVSAAVSPGAENTDVPDGDPTDSSHTPDDGHSHAGPSASPSGGPSSTPPAVGDPDASAPGSPDTADADKDRAALRREYTEACLDLRAGKLDDAQRRRLAEAPEGGQTVKNFCDRLLGDTEGAGGDRSTGGTEGAGGTEGSGGTDGSGDDSGKDDDGRGDAGTGTGTGTRTGRDGGADRAAGATGADPAVSYTPLEPYPGLADEAAPELSGDDAGVLVTRSV